MSEITKSDISLIEEIQHTKDLIIESTKDGKFTILEGLDLLISLIILLKLLGQTSKDSITYLNSVFVKQERVIENILRELLSVANCHRACITIFHNGSRVGSHHFKKMSIFYETVSSIGISFVKDKVQNKLIPNYLIELSDSNPSEFIRYSINQPNYDYEYDLFLKSIGVHTAYTRLISNKKGIYGLVDLHFVDTPDFELLDDSIKMININKAFTRISTAFDSITKNKKVPFAL